MDVTAPANEPDLQEALVDFSEILEEVEEEEYPTPSKIAFKNAKRLLLEIYKICPLRYFVSSTSEGEITIGTQTKSGVRILLLCDSHGGALCIVTMDDGSRSKSYTDASLLPDDFVKVAINQLKV